MAKIVQKERFLRSFVNNYVMPRPGVASPALVKNSRSRNSRRDPVGDVRDDALFGLLFVIFYKFKN